MVGAYNISEELLTWLKQTFPNELPRNNSISIEDIRFLQGQQDVINVIKELVSIRNGYGKNQLQLNTQKILFSLSVFIKRSI